MGQVDFNKETGAIEITYGGRESPFMGIDSTAPDPYIGPNQLTQASVNALVNNNTLIATFFQQYAYIPFNKIILGFGDLNGQVFSVSYNPTNGQVVVVGYPAWPALTGLYNIAIIDTTSVFGGALNLNVIPNTLTYKNINGICYFSFPGCPFIFQHNNMTGAILTTYLGCSFLSEMNGRLIAANVWQVTNVTSNVYIPSNPVTGVGTTANNGATTNATSSVINSFPSQAVSGTETVSLNVTFSGSFGCNPQNNGGNSAILQFQYSLDSGVHWTTFYIWTPATINQTLSSQQVTVPNLTVANIDTIQLRIVSQATAGGGVGVVSSINGNITTCSATIVGAPATITISEFPFQYAWSAGSGQYGIFNPTSYDSNGNLIATGAGYNNLPDVEDSITGLFNTGPTQFVLRGQGITEVTALNNGENPFEFDHLWASHKGIGTINPNSVGQYGSMGAFFSDTGIYTFGYEGINEITGKATSSIYTDIMITCQANLIAGGMGPVFINGEVYLVYLIAAVNPNNNIIYIWMWNSKTKEWFRFLQQMPDVPVGLQVIGVNLGNVYSTQANSIYVTVIDASGDSAYVITLPINGNTATGVINGLTTIPSNFVFPAEEIKVDRDVTINGIAVYYNCNQEIGELIGAFSINGIPFENLNVVNPNVVFDSTWRYVLLSATNLSGAFTGKNPQLTITASITGTAVQTAARFQIGKIVLVGSVDVSQEIGNE